MPGFCSLSCFTSYCRFPCILGGGTSQGKLSTKRRLCLRFFYVELNHIFLLCLESQRFSSNREVSSFITPLFLIYILFLSIILFSVHHFFLCDSFYSEFFAQRFLFICKAFVFSFLSNPVFHIFSARILQDIFLQRKRRV